MFPEANKYPLYSTKKIIQVIVIILSITVIL